MTGGELLNCSRTQAAEMLAQVRAEPSQIKLFSGSDGNRVIT
jgi:hypothetical protein